MDLTEEVDGNFVYYVINRVLFAIQYKVVLLKEKKNLPYNSEYINLSKYMC